MIGRYGLDRDRLAGLGESRLSAHVLQGRRPRRDRLSWDIEDGHLGVLAVLTTMKPRLTPLRTATAVSGTLRPGGPTSGSVTKRSPSSTFRRASPALRPSSRRGPLRA